MEYFQIKWINGLEMVLIRSKKYFLTLDLSTENRDVFVSKIFNFEACIHLIIMSHSSFILRQCCNGAFFWNLLGIHYFEVKLPVNTALIDMKTATIGNYSVHLFSVQSMNAIHSSNSTKTFFLSFWQIFLSKTYISCRYYD